MIHAEDGELIDYLEEKYIAQNLISPSDFPKTVLKLQKNSPYFAQLN